MLKLYGQLFCVFFFAVVSYCIGADSKLSGDVCNIGIYKATQLNKGSFPRSMVALAKIGRLAREQPATQFTVDDAFWIEIAENNDIGIVPIVDVDQRNTAYVGLMLIGRKYSEHAPDVSTAQLISACHAVLSWGLLTDYLAVSGCLARIEKKFGCDYFINSQWEKLFSVLYNVDLYFENELLFIDAQPAAKRSVRDIYAGLFLSKSIQDFKQRLMEMVRQMDAPSGTVSSEVKALFFQGPALESLAVPVYRNRSIYDEITAAINIQTKHQEMKSDS